MFWPIFFKITHAFFAILPTALPVISLILCVWSANQGTISTLDTACPTVLQIALLAIHTTESVLNVILISAFLPTHAPHVMWPTACPATQLISARNATLDISSITKLTRAIVQILRWDRAVLATPILLFFKVIAPKTVESATASIAQEIAVLLACLLIV